MPYVLTAIVLAAVSVGYMVAPESEVYDQQAFLSNSASLKSVAVAPAPKVAMESKKEVNQKRETGDLLPDLAPLPPQDIALTKRADGATMLVFSTTYYNQGDGLIELRPDEKTKGIRSDIEREVYQRIYNENGGSRDVVVGTFLWHQTHLHYHYSDFAEYDLAPVDAPDDPSLAGTRAKATYCLRDVSRVDMELANRSEDAKYKICGKELQGVSVGWGDTYLYNYPDQGLNITGLASGTYRLTFYVNPLRKLEELRYGNNTASALLDINIEKGTVKVVAEDPAEYPKIEHVYLDPVSTN